MKRRLSFRLPPSSFILRFFYPVLFGTISLIVFQSLIAAAVAADEPQQADLPKPGWLKPSDNPALKIPQEKWSLPAIRPPQPRVRTPEEKALLPPPDRMVVYTRATGEIRYEPPLAGADLRLKPSSDSRPSSTGLLGQLPGLFNIIGTDERVRVSPTTDFPWRVVGKIFIRFPNNSNWVGSGALIDPFHVLTAGHVVYDADQGGWATQIEFVPGMDGNFAPFSSAWDVQLRAPSGWTESNDAEYDWGLITLDRNVGNILGWLGYAYEALDYYPNRRFNLAGYPAELAEGLGLYWAANYATRATENVLYHVIDSTAGQSGAPIWRLDEVTNDRHIMAVHNRGGATENSGARINATRFESIETWKGEDPSPGDKADLIDDGVSYAGFDPPSVSPGAPFEVHADVRNIGTAMAMNFDVTFYASTDQEITPFDSPIGSVHVASLLSFEYVTCTWRGPLPANIPLGNYYVGWIIDVGNTVTEFDETNNKAYLPTQLVVGTQPNLRFAWGDFLPAAPTQTAPGSPLTLVAHIQNNGGSTATPFWLEFWGSRSGGLTTNIFLASSARPGPIGPGVTYPFSSAIPLDSIPDGPYTVVMIADRPNDVAESNESDNRQVVGGKRLLVIRPQTNADLLIGGFSFGPNPVYSGQAITMTGAVQNIGSENSGPFWIEFWGSYSRPYPSPDFFLCDSIPVGNLAPGAAIDLSQYPRTLYGTPSGTFMVGVLVDRLDQVSERDETNNYEFLDGYRLNRASEAPGELDNDVNKQQLPDLVVATSDFAPYSPYQAPPGTPLTIWARVENRSNYAVGPFWVEFWGSRTGGLTLDEFLADSTFVAGLPAWGAYDLALSRSLYSVPDGPYSVVVAVDRPGQAAETNEGNNRRAVAEKRLLTIRPQTQANLVVQGFTISPNPLHLGLPMAISGRVRNTGTQNSGPFWIEFFGTTTPNAPQLDFFLCDSIPVADLWPGWSVEFSNYPRVLYSSVPVGSIGVICFADRTDLVNETHEEDNYVALKNYSVSP